MSHPTHKIERVNRTQNMRFYPLVFNGKEKGYECGFHYFGTYLHMSQNAYNTQVKPTLYPSPYLVFTNRGYTKHYYAGAERVAARIGGGNLNHDTECIVDDGEAIERSNNLFWQCSDMVNSAVIEHRDLEEMNIVNIDNDEMEAMWKFDMKQVPSMMKAEVIPEPWKILDAIEYFSQPNSIVSQGDDDEPNVYFYHSDHLGSASWITDGAGIPVQHLQYLPYGEPFVNQRAAGSTYSERFRFTGKERDAETGFGYFGARYMDHELMTMWLSVDPLADKYPSISPYNYCMWNPVKLVDPDGRDVYINGAQADRAVERLQTEKMKITRDPETGKLSVDIGNYKRRNLSKHEKMIYDAIMSENVTVQVTASATHKATDDNGNLVDAYYGDDGKSYKTYGGSFHGASYSEHDGSGCAFTRCFMDVDLMDKNGANQAVPHEISEQYLLGKMAIKKKGNIKPAFIIQGKSNPEYLEAHEKAIPQNVSGCNEILGFIEIPHKSVFTYTQQRLNEQK